MSSSIVKCPTCRREIDWSASQYRPFCSERCRLIDLGAWLAQKHVIAGDTSNSNSDDRDPPETQVHEVR